MLGKINIRCDANSRIGFGHLSRCQLIAIELARCNLAVTFQTKFPDFFSGPKKLGFKIKKVGDLWSQEPWITESKVLIIDLPDDIPSNDQLKLKSQGLLVMNFDGRRNTPTYARWLVDLRPIPAPEHFESTLRRCVDTEYLAGPAFVPLPNPPAGMDIIKKVSMKILVSMGAGDDRGSIVSLLKTLDTDKHLPKCNFLIQVGSSNPSIDQIKRTANDLTRHSAQVLIGAPLINTNSASCSIAIMAGGMSCYEACAMGLPLLIMPIASNQTESARQWQGLGAGIDCGLFSESAHSPNSPSCSNLAKHLNALMTQPKALKQMKAVAQDQTTWNGSKNLANHLIHDACQLETQ